MVYLNETVIKQEISLSLQEKHKGAVSRSNSRSTRDLVRFRAYCKALQAQGVDLLKLGQGLVESEKPLENKAWSLAQAKLWIMYCLGTNCPEAIDLPRRWGRSRRKRGE